MALTDAGQDPTPKSNKGLAAVLPYTTVLLVLALLYVAWTFYSRRQSAKEAAAQLEEKQQEQRDKVANQIFGSGEVKFTTFSAEPGRLKRGQTARICYGVVNAKTLKLDPAPNEEVKPTSRHCLDVAPKETTTYTITGANEKGQTQTQTLTIKVE